MSGGDVGPGDFVGDYRLESPLGEGAMGRVYEASDPGGVRVALKLARPEATGDALLLERLRREAESVARVAHKRVVKVLDAGDHEGLPFLVQQLVRGETLQRRLEREQSLDLDSTVILCLQVGGALDALHEAGLVHRDLKPANILLDEEGGAHVTDFGLMKDVKASVLTKIGVQPGTINYMAPEQVRGEREKVGPTTDVYALGCVMFACISGAPPFSDRSSGMRTLWAHLQDEPPDLTEARDDLPDGVGWTITRALAKEPEERPPTATAYARMLQLAARDKGDGSP